MCKTYDAIIEMKKQMEVDTLIVYIEGAEVKGSLQCECDCKKHECHHDIITLKDATVTCKHTHETKEFKMFNIPSMWIKAFYFSCCIK
jgi:hypothetical protein